MSRTNSNRDDKIHHSDSRSLHSPSPSSFPYVVNSAALSGFPPGAPFPSYPPIGFTDIPNYLLNPTYLAMDVFSNALMHANQVGPPPLFPLSLMHPPLGSPGLGLHSAPPHLLLPSPSFSPGFDRASSAENRETHTPTFKPKLRKKTSSEASLGSASTLSEKEQNLLINNEFKERQSNYSPSAEQFVQNLPSRITDDYNDSQENIPLSLVTRNSLKDIHSVSQDIKEETHINLNQDTNSSESKSVNVNLIEPSAHSVSPVRSDCSYPDRPATGHSTVESIEICDSKSFTQVQSDADYCGVIGQSRSVIALPPRKRLLRNADDDILSTSYKGSTIIDTPNEIAAQKDSVATASSIEIQSNIPEGINEDSPQSSNFRSCWKKFSAKASNIPGPSNLHHRLYFGLSNKPNSFIQKMAAAAAGRDARSLFMARGGRYFHHLQKSTSRKDGSGRQVPDGSTSPRVTRSQAKQRQKKGDPVEESKEPKDEASNQDDTQIALAEVRKSTRKKTNNSKYDAPHILKPPKYKGKMKLIFSNESEQENTGVSNNAPSELDDQRDSETSNDLKLSVSTAIVEGSCEAVEFKAINLDEVTDNTFDDESSKDKRTSSENDQRSNVSSSELSTDNADINTDQIALPPKFRKKTKNKIDEVEDKETTSDNLMICSVKMERLPESNECIAQLASTTNQIDDLDEAKTNKKSSKNIFEEIQSLKVKVDQIKPVNVDIKKANNKVSKSKNDIQLTDMGDINCESDKNQSNLEIVTTDVNKPNTELTIVEKNNISNLSLAESEKLPKNKIRVFFKEPLPDHDSNIESNKSLPNISLKIDKNKLSQVILNDQDDQKLASDKKRKVNKKRKLIPDPLSDVKIIHEAFKNEGTDKLDDEIINQTSGIPKDLTKEISDIVESGDCDLVMACTSEGEEHVAINRYPALIKQIDKTPIKVESHDSKKQKRSRKIDRTGFPKPPKKKKKKINIEMLDGISKKEDLIEKKAVDIYEYDPSLEFEDEMPLLSFRSNSKVTPSKIKNIIKDTNKSKKNSKLFQQVENIKNEPIEDIAKNPKINKRKKLKDQNLNQKTKLTIDHQELSITAEQFTSSPFRSITPRLFQPQMPNMFSPNHVSPYSSSGPFSPPVTNDDRRIPASIKTQNWLANISRNNSSKEDDKGDLLSSPESRKILSPIRVKFKLKKSGNEWVSVNDKNPTSAEKRKKKTKKKKEKKEQTINEDLYSPYVPIHIAAGVNCSNSDLLEVFLGNRKQILVEDFFEPVLPNWLANQSNPSFDDSQLLLNRNELILDLDKQEENLMVSPASIFFPPTELEASLTKLHISSHQDSSNKNASNIKIASGNWFNLLRDTSSSVSPTHNKLDKINNDNLTNNYSSKTLNDTDYICSNTVENSAANKILSDSDKMLSFLPSSIRRDTDLMLSDSCVSLSLEGANLDLLFWDEGQVYLPETDEFWEQTSNLTPLCAT